MNDFFKTNLFFKNKGSFIIILLILFLGNLRFLISFYFLNFQIKKIFSQNIYIIVTILMYRIYS